MEKKMPWYIIISHDEIKSWNYEKWSHNYEIISILEMTNYETNSWNYDKDIRRYCQCQLWESHNYDKKDEILRYLVITMT